MPEEQILPILEKINRELPEEQSKQLRQYIAQIREEKFKDVREIKVWLFQLIDYLKHIRFNKNTINKLNSLVRFLELKTKLKNNEFDVDRITDRLGYGIDGLIKPLVIALIHLGFETEQSCQGHLDHGEKHPWIRLQANKNFNELVRIIQEYNLSHPTKWKFLKFANPTTMFTSSVNIIRSDRKELSQEEFDSLIDYCKNVIEENRFELNCNAMKNDWIVILPEHESHNEDIKRIFPIIKQELSKKGYDVTMNISEDSKEPDTYQLFAEGDNLEQMQEDIIPFSEFILENFKSSNS